MEWLAANASTIVVFVVLVVVVGAIVRGMLNGNASCEGFSGACSECGSRGSCTELADKLLEEFDAASSQKGSLS